MSLTEKTDIRDSDEKVVEIEMERLRTFTNHPFKVIGDSQMIELQDSIKKYAAERLGYKKIPVIIRMMQDDEAVVTMVDSNLQREQITPSEKAYAYKMKYDAIKKKEQQEIIDAMEATQCTPSLSQAIRIKKLSEAGKLTESEAEGILGEIKQKEADRVVFKNEQLYRFFPPTYTSEPMRREILEILKSWRNSNWI
ncbi:MAG: ParB/RepB/Spo0J family partition protein [Roseburia sp.]